MHDAELKLAIAACRASFRGEASADFAPSLEGVDWTRLLHLARRHRIEALCWHGLAPVREALPEQIELELRRAAGAIAETNLRIAAESVRLAGLFRERQLPLLFLKGLTLGALAYSDPFRKMGWDIDLLVDRDRLPDAADLLRSAGYAPLIPKAADQDRLERWHRRRKESVWYRPEGEFHLDLHTRLADNPAMLAAVGVGSPAQTVEVAPGIVLPTLDRDELFAYLAVHGASSAWFRLKWLADFAALISGDGAAEIERLYRRSQQLGAGRAAGQALLLAERLFAIDLGERLLRSLQGDRTTRWLARLAAREIARPHEPTEVRLGTAGIHFSQFGLLPGLRFKLSEAARQLLDIVGRGAA